MSRVGMASNVGYYKDASIFGEIFLATELTKQVTEGKIQE